MTQESRQAKHDPEPGDYSAPTLSIYGDLQNLTAAGSMGSSSEGSMTTDKTRKK